MSDIELHQSAIEAARVAYEFARHEDAGSGAFIVHGNQFQNAEVAVAAAMVGRRIEGINYLEINLAAKQSVHGLALPSIQAGAFPQDGVYTTIVVTLDSEYELSSRALPGILGNLEESLKVALEDADYFWYFQLIVILNQPLQD